VVIALGFSLAIMISLPPGILANQQFTQNLTSNYDKTVSQMEQQLTLITCTNSSSTNSSSFPYGGGYARFGGFGGQENYMDESVADAIDSIQGVEAVVPILDVPEGVTSQTFTGFGGRTFTLNVSAYTIEGVPLNSSFISDNYVPLPTNITEGRNLESGDSGKVVLSLNNTEYFGAGIGGEVNINGTNFQVVGVHGESGSSAYVLGQAADVRTLYMNISDAQAVSGLTGKMSSIYVYADNSSDVSSVAQEISSLFPLPFSVTTEESELQTIEGLYNSTLATNEAAIGQTQTVAFEEIIVAVVATSLIVLFVMLYTVRERTKEIGTLKAIGFSNWNVMSQFMLEGMLLSFVAGIAGIAIGSVGAPTLSALLLPHITNPFSTSAGRFGGGGFVVGRGPGAGAPGVDIAAAVATAVPSLQLMLAALGGAVLLGALGSLYPAWRASRTRPAEAMRYE
jgi:ABC-type antimicrobial peptide transport system permease subunit